MREVQVTAQTAAGDNDKTRFLNEFEKLRTQGSGLYRMFYMDDGGELYILVTTSKDVILALSTLSAWARSYLCNLLETECVQSDDSSVVFSVPQEDDTPEAARKRQLYVAMTKSAARTLFHISPVR